MSILDLVNSFDDYKKKRGESGGEIAGPPVPEMIPPVKKETPAPMAEKKPSIFGVELPKLPEIKLPAISDENKQKIGAELNLWKESLKYMPNEFLNPEQVGKNFSKATDEFFQGAAKGVVGGFFGLGNLFLSAAPESIRNAGQQEYKRLYEKLQPSTPVEQIGSLGESLAEIAAAAGVTKVALLKAPSILKFAQSYPKIFDALSLGVTGTGLGQVRTVPDATFQDRLKKAVIDFPTWALWGAAGGIAPKAVYKYYPAYFALGYTSAKLEGASNEDSIISGLVGATISSIFHITAKPERAESLLRKNAEATLKKYGVTDEASLKAFRNKYHPDISQQRTGVPPAEAQKIFTKVGQAWDVVNTTPEVRQKTIMEEMANLWNAVKGKPQAQPAPAPAPAAPAPLLGGEVAPEAIKPTPTIPVRPSRVDKINEILNQIPAAKPTEKPMQAPVISGQAKPETPVKYSEGQALKFDGQPATIKTVMDRTPNGGSIDYELEFKDGRIEWVADTYLKDHGVPGMMPGAPQAAAAPKAEIYPSADEAIQKITDEGGKSIYKYPYAQSEYVMGKILKGEDLPDDPQFNNLAIDLWRDGGLDISETGPGTKVNFEGMFFETAETVGQSRVYYVKLNDMISPDSYEEATGRSVLDAEKQDPQNLQVGYGVGTSLRIGDPVKSLSFPVEKTIERGKNKGQKKYEPGLGVIEDIFDNEKAVVFANGKHQVVDFNYLQDVIAPGQVTPDVAKQIEALRQSQATARQAEPKKAEKPAAPEKKPYQRITEVDALYSPERLKLHKEIIDKLIDNPVVDPDIIKEMLPEYDKDHPELVHDESSHITRKLLVAKIRALKDKPDRSAALNIGPAGAGKTSVLRPKTGPYDLIYEVTGSSIGKLESVLRWFKRKGFTVDVNLVGITLKQSIESQALRKQGGFRNIPPRIVQENYPSSFTSFNKLRELADNWRAFDHREIGKPVLVAEKIGNSLNIIDKKGYNELVRGFPYENKLYEQETRQLGEGEGAGQREHLAGGVGGSDEGLGAGDTGRPTRETEKIKTEKTIERPPVSGAPEGGFASREAQIKADIAAGLEKSKKITKEQAYKIAVNFYAYEIKRGDTLKQIQSGYGGGTLPDHTGFIAIKGGGKVEVHLADDRRMIFSLQKIFNDVTEAQKPVAAAALRKFKAKGIYALTAEEMMAAKLFGEAKAEVSKAVDEGSRGITIESVSFNNNRIDVDYRDKEDTFGFAVEDTLQAAIDKIKADNPIEGEGTGKTPEPVASATPETPKALAGLENDISKAEASRAHNATSFDPEKRGALDVVDYVQTLTGQYEDLQKLATTPEKQAILDEEFSRYRAGYQGRYRAVLQAESRTMSPMITGPANFPVARNQKRLATVRNRWDDLQEFERKALARIRNTINPTVFKGTSEKTIDEMGTRLEELKKQQATMKEANRIIRSKNDVTRRLMALGMNEEAAATLQKPDFAGRVGFPDYSLTSINNKIKTLETRQAQTKSKRETFESKGNETIQIGDAKVVKNYDENRLQLIYPGKPDQAVIADLKGRGFRWSPSNKAWQRILTPDAIYAASKILKIEPQELGRATPKAPEAAVETKPAAAKKIPAHEVAAAIIDKRASLPILTEISVKDGKMFATDLDVAVNLTSGLPDGMYKPVGKEMMKTNSDPADFPAPPVLETPAKKFRILTEKLAPVLKQAAVSLPRDTLHPQLNGVFVRLEKNEIDVVATDSFRMYMKRMPAKVLGSGDFIISNPAKVAKVLPAVGATADISLGTTADKSGEMVQLEGTEGDIFARKIDADYPDIVAVIPSYTQRISFNRKEMAAAFAKLKPFAKEFGTLQAGINYADGKFTIEIYDQKTGNTKSAEVPGVAIGVKTAEKTINSGVVLMPIARMDPLGRFTAGDISYNISYFQDALRSLDNDSVYLYKNDQAGSPVFFSNEAQLAAAPEKPRVPAGEASPGGSKLGEFEPVGTQPPSEEEMKLYEEVKSLVRKYARTIGEDYLPGSAAGVYYGDTGNIRINGLNQVSVAAHEITHFLDHAYNISQQLMGIRGYSVDGKPLYDKDTLKFRKELTDIYERFYPGAKRTHKLSKRMLEGFATLLEKFVTTPSTMIAEYPTTVREFLASDGRFYKPVMGDIIQDLRNLVARYQGLNALDKIGARVVSGKVNIDKESFLNFGDMAKTEIADEVYPIEKLAIESGTHFTKADPSLWVRQYSNSNALILGNIKGDRGFWGWRNGDLIKIHDYNWQSLIKQIQDDKKTDEFAYYLVARREHFAFQEMHKLEDKANAAREAFEQAGELAYEKPAGGLTGEKSLADLFKEAAEEYNSLKDILDKDGFTEAEVTEAYLQNKDRFPDYERKFDQLVREDLEFLHDPYVQLISDEEYTRLADQEGYATFKRFFYDEIVGEEQPLITRVATGRTKVSAMMHRIGSQKPIVNPLFSSLTNHAEATRKGLKQTVYNRIGNIAGSFPRLFQQIALKGIPDTQGRILYPQEKDNNIVMARINYKRVPILTDSIIKRTIDEVLNTQNISTFEKLMMGASRFFTKGTTGLFPGFSLTNYTVDQVTGAAQSRNGYIPVYDPLGKLFKMLDNNRPEHTYLMEYLVMGGEKQTFVGWQDMTPDELFEAISNERKGLLKVVDALNAGMNILALPAQWSEIMTRATEYIKARQAGKPEVAALEEAGRITAPFHHVGRLGGGRFGKTFIKSIPFFNPGIQVLAQAAETIGSPKGRARYGFTALGIVAASIAAFAYLLANGTEEQKDLYADINPDELNKYIFLPNPDGKSLIKVRVPDQMEVPATLINMLWADKILDAQYGAGEYFSATMSWLPQQFDLSQPAKALMAWIPQIMKPGVLTMAGVKDYPKIMPLESQSQQAKPPGLRFTESTSPVAKALGEKLNISPIKIDYLLTGYVGRAVGFLTGKPGIYNPFTAMSRQYYFDSGRKVQHYYELKEKNDQDYYAFKHGLKTFTPEQRKEKQDLRERLKAIDNLLSDYRDIDPDKEPEKAARFREEILKRINAL